MQSANRLVFWIAGLIIVMAGASAATAQVTILLPFEGRFHPGRFMPVRVISPRGNSSIELSAAGAVSTTLTGPVESETIVPLLAMSDSLSRLQIAGGPVVELKPLAEHQRLVAFGDADANSARSLFPADEIVPVALDLSRRFLDPALAWTGLDAIVLSPSARSRMSDAQISTLLSAGVVLIVNDSKTPDPIWPWRRRGDAWILQHTVAGPPDPIRAEAYTPTYTWDRGLPVFSRRQIVFMAVIFAILACGASLWRSRYATAGFVGLCALTVFVVWLVHLRHPPELLMQKAIAVRDSELTQVDHWNWRGCLRDSRLTQPVSQLTLPVFASLHQVEQSRLRLKCDPRGQPVEYEFDLAPDQSLAFVTRDVVISTAIPILSKAEPIWMDFASDLYVSPGDQISGEAHLNEEPATTLIVGRAPSKKLD